jgi:glycerol-3-phosphate acyltransferase PlsY
MLELGLKVLLSYLAGSLNGALIVGRLAGGVDIRQLGSGNAGGTNALRTQGKAFAAWVVLIDVSKGFLPAWILPGLELPGVVLDPAISRTWLTLACAGAAVVGHCYPVFFEFAGGKGAATAVGAMLAIAPVLLLPLLAIWVLVIVVTGYVGLATILATAAMPAWLLLTGQATRHELLTFTLLLALFIAWTHRANVRRMLAGSENRMQKAMLLRRGR